MSLKHLKTLALIALLATSTGLVPQTIKAAPKTVAASNQIKSGAQKAQEALLTDTLHLRHLARNDMAVAIELKSSDAGKKVLQKLGAETWPEQLRDVGWPHFFVESVAMLGEIQNDAALSAFYHPWSDVFLVLRWVNTGKEWKVEDADWITGDWIRQAGNGPTDVQPMWLRGNAQRSGALALSIAESVKAFEGIFLNEYPLDDWRGMLNLQTSGPRAHFNRSLASARLNAVLMNQVEFNVPLEKNDPVPQAVRTTTGKAIQALEKGKMNDLLSQAKKTETVQREALAKVDAGALKALFPVFYFPANTARKSPAVLYLLSEYHADFALALHFSTKLDRIEAMELIPFAAVVEAGADIKGN